MCQRGGGTGFIHTASKGYFVSEYKPARTREKRRGCGFLIHDHTGLSRSKIRGRGAEIGRVGSVSGGGGIGNQTLDPSPSDLN